MVRFQVITRDGRGLWISALVVPHICDVRGHSISEDVLKQHPYLMNLDLADEAQGETSMSVDVLVGADFYWALASGRVLRGKEDGPAAIETRVGWVLSGPIGKEDTSAASDGIACFHVNTVTDRTSTLNEDLRRFWSLESLGIRPVEESVRDRFAQITFRDGRYEVGLPWRLDRNKLADNFDTCVRRLRGLHRRLLMDPDLCKAYDEVLKGQLDGGVIERVASSEVAPPPGTHYLPHHPVVRKDKTTTKVRVVYDASCKNDHGDNQCLHVGPSFDEFILDILLRFWTHKIALVGDVEKAFLMVGVAPEDRDFLRFLYPNSPEPELVTYRFTRVVFGVSSSPFLLNATIRHHVQQYKGIDPSFVLKFLRSVYVDDLTTGGVSIDYCYQLYRKSKSRLAEGGFNLRKFQSNSCELLERIRLEEGPGELSARPSGKVEGCEEVHKVLGITWDPVKDEFLFDIRPIGRQLLDLKFLTKRTIVGIAAKVYDPLGILSPVTITFKIFFQRLCKARLDWDDPLSVELREAWQSLVLEASQLDPIAIPRHLPNVSERLGENDVPAHLVGFCDASKEPYAAVVYMRVIHAEGVSVSLLASKTRVSPMKDATIPRLELSSLLLAGWCEPFRKH